MRVTQRFGISGPVDFVDVNVLKDNRLYVDPATIRYWAKRNDPWCQAAYQSMCDFLDVVLHHIQSPGRHAAGRLLLAEFHEPRQTRLGMSRHGYSGSGASTEIGEGIWDAMVTNPLCLLDVPILRRVEQLALYVDDISNDRVSDLTSRIIFEDLVDFTTAQMVKHPTLVAGAAREFQVWDKGALAWTKRSIALPDAGTSKVEPLLLVPKRAVHRSLRMSARGMWQVPVLGAVRDSEATVLGNGKVRKPTKRALKQRAGLRNIRPTNQTWTERMWNEHQINLLAQYEGHVDAVFEPLSDAEIDARVAR